MIGKLENQIDLELRIIEVYTKRFVILFEQLLIKIFMELKRGQF